MTRSGCVRSAPTPLRIGETLLPPLPDSRAESALGTADDGSFRSRRDGYPGLYPACPSDGQVFLAGGRRAERKLDLCAPLSKRWRSSAGADNRSASSSERQQHALPMSMASLLFSKDVDMREQRYRQFSKKPTRLTFKAKQYLQLPREASSAQTGKERDDKSKEGSGARIGAPADVTCVQFIDFTEVKHILLKDKKPPKSAEPRKTIVADRSEIASAVSGRLGVALASGAAHRHFGVRSVGKLYRGSFLTVGVPITIKSSEE